jgi:(R)-amidase
MQVELAQLALTDGDVERNTALVIDSIETADVAGGTALIVFPETTLSGFPTRDTVFAIAQPLDGAALGAVRAAARRVGVAVAVGLAERDGGHCYNTSVLIDARGEIALRYRKVHLWATDVGVFTAGDRFTTCRWNGMTVGLQICYDIEFPEGARALASLGADLLIVTNGNMEPLGPVHRRAMAARAMENQVFAVMVNRCGEGDDDLVFAGESALLDPFGECVASAGRGPTTLRVRIAREQLAASRRDYRYLADARVPLGLVRGEQADTLLIPPTR